MSRTIIVTGASGGIGQALAKTLQEASYHVIGIDWMPTPCAHVDAYYAADLAHVAACESIVQTIGETWGSSLHGLINNAGVYDALDFGTTTPAQYDRVLAINLRAPFFLSQYFARQITAHHRQGVIINIASISGESGSKDVAYGASKGGLITLTKSLALALAPDIRVNSISPGIIDTAMAAHIPADRLLEYKKRILLRRLGTPKDVAQAALFLLDDKSEYITGSMISVNGGM